MSTFLLVEEQLRKLIQDTEAAVQERKAFLPEREAFRLTRKLSAQEVYLRNYQLYLDFPSEPHYDLMETSRKEYMQYLVNN